MFFVIIAIIGIVAGLLYHWIMTIVVFFFGFVWFLISYFAADKMVLAVSRARPVTKEEFPHVFHSIEGIAIAAGLPTPQMYIIDDTAINAFATGKDPEHSAIVLTTGIIQRLNRQEIEGVIAHEMSHIKNRDVRLMVISAILVGVIALMSDLLLRVMFFSRGNKKQNPIVLILGLIFLILAPISALFIQLAISRKREYLADANGALLTRYPEGLASALEKIKNDKEPLEVANKATAPMYIANPLKNSKSFLKNAFSTHPPIDDRIAKLRAM
ncbi:M48 family metallopeptidase [archaeon]|nr:M48 family metallopeptidase [archaeon]